MSLGPGQAIRAGVRRTLAQPEALLALFLSELAAILAQLLFNLGALSVLTLGGATVVAAGAGLLAAWLVAAFLRVLVIGAAVRRGAPGRPGPPEGLAAAMVACAPPVLAYALWDVVLQLLRVGWQWVLLAAASASYLLSLVTPGGAGVLGAAALAVAVVLVVGVAFFLTLILRLAFVRAVLQRAGYLESLGRSARRLLEDPLPASLVELAVGVALAAVSGWILLGRSSAGSGFDRRLVALAAAGAVAEAIVRAVLELARFQAFAALLATPIPKAELVLDARPVQIPGPSPVP